MDELDPVLVKQATDLGIRHIDVMGNTRLDALLANAIKTTQTIYNAPEFQLLPSVAAIFGQICHISSAGFNHTSVNI